MQVHLDVLVRTLPLVAGLALKRVRTSLLVRHLGGQSRIDVVVGLGCQFNNDLVERSSERERGLIGANCNETVASDIESFERRPAAQGLWIVDAGHLDIVDE